MKIIGVETLSSGRCCRCRACRVYRQESRRACGRHPKHKPKHCFDNAITDSQHVHFWHPLAAAA